MRAPAGLMRQRRAASARFTAMTESHGTAANAEGSFIDRYVRGRLYFWILNLVFMVAGIGFGLSYFTEIAAWRAAFGGGFFGLFCALCCFSHTQTWD